MSTTPTHASEPVDPDNPETPAEIDTDATASENEKNSGTRATADTPDSEQSPGNSADLQEHNARGGDSLGSPPRPTLLPEFETRACDSGPGAETRAEGNSGDQPVSVPEFPAPGGDTYVPVESTAEEVAAATAFTEAQKSAEKPAEKPRARLHGAVFSLMQYRSHPETGEVMWTQEQIDAGIRGLLDDGYEVKGADIWHGLDRHLVEVDGRQVAEGELKPLHWHGVLWVVGGDLTARQVADRFEIPLRRVQLPRELAAQEGREPRKGRGSAENAFFDYCEYLVHENTRAREEEKYHYPYAAVRTWCS